MISVCTFTGIDAKTDLNRVRQISERFPFVEFGVLLTLSPEDNDARYMDISVVKLVLRELHGVNTALHICGKAVDAFVSGEPKVRQLCLDADRVQLNFKADIARFTIEELDKVISRVPVKVITQHFPSNSKLVDQINSSNHQILHDLSGGRGIATTNWSPPFEHKITGYAGGLGPETIDEMLPKIIEASGASSCWIDMENRIRTNGYLDLDLCEAIAAKVAPFINPDELARTAVLG